MVVGERGHGSLLGEIAFLTGGKRNASAAAKEKTTLARLRAPAARDWFTQYSDMKRRFFEIARDMLRLNQWLTIMTRYFVHGGGLRPPGPLRSPPCYRAPYSHYFHTDRKVFPAIEFLVEVLQHLPDSRSRLIRPYGLYSSRTRGTPGPAGALARPENRSRPHIKESRRPRELFLSN
jgi:hypothetical protein